MVPPYVCTEGNGGLYEQFHVNVEGSGQLRENAEIFERLANEYNQHRFALQDALKAITVTYTGQGADAMRGVFEPLIESVGQGYDLCRRSAVLLTDQGGGFDVAQAKIQKPVDVPPKPWLNSLTPWDTAYDKAVEQNSRIDSANQQAYAKYAMTSLANWAQAPNFDSATSGFGDVTVVNDQRKTPGDPGQVVANRRLKDSRWPGDSHVPPPMSSPGPPPAGSPDGGPVRPRQHGGADPRSDVLPTHDRDGGTATQGYLPLPPSGGNDGGQLVLPYGSERKAGGEVGSGPVGGFGSVESSRGGGKGPGGGLGSGGRGMGVLRSGEGATSGRGVAAARGAVGAPSAGVGGAAGRKEADEEHKSAAYLVTEENGGQIIGDLPSTTPPVIGG